MPEPIRVRDDKLGHEYSTYGTAEPGLTKLDEPAVDERGDLLPPKYPTKTAAPVVQSTTGPKATTKES
jgi:hypothetical protein